MKVLITGATGLLGGHLLLALQQGGEQMRVGLAVRKRRKAECRESTQRVKL